MSAAPPGFTGRRDDFRYARMFREPRLGHLFGKLGVGSRTQLAVRVAANRPAPGAGED